MTTEITSVRRSLTHDIQVVNVKKSVSNCQASDSQHLLIDIATIGKIKIKMKQLLVGT